MKAKDWILIIAMILLMIVCPFAKAQNFYSDLNAYRANKGLPPLKVSKKLEKRSLSWAKYLNESNKVCHQSIKQWTIETMECVGESPVILQSWMRSEGHRNILMSRNITHIGFATINGKSVAKLY